jgi:membrane protein
MFGGFVIGMMAQLEEWLPSLGAAGIIAGKVLAYVLLAFVAAAAAATLYRFGPCCSNSKWKWITPGSVFFALGWVILTLGFGFYVARFGKYNVTYGSLGGVIVFITWLYLSTYILHYGAEFNSEVEKQARNGCAPNRRDEQLDGLRGPAGNRPDGPLSLPATDVRAGVCNDVHPDNFRLALDRSGPPLEHGQPYIAARVTNRAGSIVGMRKVGMISSALATLGLSMLRQRGRETFGLALLAGAVGLSLHKRAL